MCEKKCSHLIEQGHDTQADHYLCGITKNVCVASTFENPDYGHPASYEVAEYQDYLAEQCPCYDVHNLLVENIKKHWEKK